MPHINIQMLAGATREQKAEVVKEITATMARVLGKKPEHTNIVFQEIEDEDWGFGGVLCDEP